MEEIEPDNEFDKEDESKTSLLGEALHSNQKLYPVTMLYPVTIMSISDKLEKSRLVCNHVSFAQRSLITVALDTDWSHTI